MYLYFDKTGTLKEIINDEALRQGNYGINKLYIYVDGQTVESIEASYLLPSGRIVAPESFDDIAIAPDDEIPFDRKRDLRFFKYFTKYPFIVVNLDKEVDDQENILHSGALDEAGVVHASLIAYLDGGAQLVLGGLNFEVQRDSTYNTHYVASEEYLSLADYTYLKSVIYGGLDSKWTKFVGTTEERLAAIKNTNTLYVDTTTGLDYIWNGSSFIALGENINLSITADNDNHIKSIYYNGTTYYPTKFILFSYISDDDTEIIEGDVPSLTDYNENYLYYNLYNDAYYRYDKGNESLMLTGTANCNFRLTYDDRADRYALLDGDIVRLRKIAKSMSAAAFVMFKFVGGEYDGRKYLMNYNYNSTAHKYDFVCVDLDIHEQQLVLVSAEKFRLSLLDNATTGVYGEWFKVDF